MKITNLNLLTELSKYPEKCIILNTYRLKPDVDVYWGVHFILFHRKILSFFFCQKDSKIENTTVDALQPLLSMDKTNQISEKVTKGEARSVLMKRCSETMQ